MSVRGMIEVAAQRDQGQPQTLPSKPTSEAEVKKVQPAGYLDLLITAIPTELLALYTFLVGGIATTIKDDANQHLTMRWIIFGASAAFIVLWMAVAYLRIRDQARKVPVAEIASAVVAFCAWGLVMPESPLGAELSSQNQTIWTFIITAAGAGALGLLTGTLKKPAKPDTATDTPATTGV